MKTAEGELLKDDVSNYDSSRYEKPSVTVDICLCTIRDGQLQVLLIKRKYPPYKDMWCFPGGFVDVPARETLEETAARELREETGLTGLFLEQLKTYGDPGRDPRMRIITVAYYAIVPYDRIGEIKAASDAREAAWFNIREEMQLGFDHNRIRADLLARITGKLSYSPIAFSFVPRQFTWKELQNVFEIILNQKLVASNFGRDIRGLFVIEELPEKASVAVKGRKPVMLLFKGMKQNF